jgi:DNA-directed RNA polymerase specialized sigma24 family protein
MFFDYINDMRIKGLTDPEIARGLDMSTTDFRIVNSIARNREKAAKIAYATYLKEKKGYSNMAIGTKMGINESSVRSLLAPGQKEKTDILATTADMLRKQIAEKGVIDIGKGVENDVGGISKERLATAVSILKEEGYAYHNVQAPQLGTGGLNKTTIRVLAKPGTTYPDIVKDIGQIKSIGAYTENNGRSWYGLLPPISINSKRVEIVYAEDGGSALDGVIYVRPGKDDISLGGSRYAQVRIMVDGTHYIKGMAIYKNDMPDGVDLMVNTNKLKSKVADKLDVLKPLVQDANNPGKPDPDNPFGAIVDQIGTYNDKGELAKVTSAMNLVNKEGDWSRWKNTISTQVLSKQSPTLAKTQLDMTYERSKTELNEILALTNPSVRRKLLESYADGADASAVHLKAASLPRQKSQVLLPINSIKETEVYAPNFRNGERVALIRFPHGGTFEIPELVVNNRHPEAKALLGSAPDAIAVNSEVAKRLSGADFDGDTVLVIPNPITNPLLKTTPALEGLKNFDPQSSYPEYPGMPKITTQTKNTQMGFVSNLITDMSIGKANSTELAAAVRHSMVVIDSEKHNLDYKLSAINNGIPNLMLKYQGRKSGGSSTLISKAKSRIDIPRQKPQKMDKGGPVDKATGKKVFEPTNESYVNSKGKVIPKTQRSKKLAETDDAHTLSSGTLVEKVYADHSNRMKSLANAARKEAVNTTTISREPSAAKVYAREVDTLTAKLREAQANSPRERQAQVIANTISATKKQASPNMDHTQKKRIEAQALDEARRRTGARKPKIEIDENEWSAIQAGAISPTRLKSILDNSNLDRVKELATPRTQLLMTSVKTRRAQSMANSGYTQAEIADALGVSLTTLKTGLMGE